MVYTASLEFFSQLQFARLQFTLKAPELGTDLLSGFYSFLNIHLSGVQSSG